MAKTLAELRTSTSTGLPRRTYSICLANALLAEMGALVSELADIGAEPVPRDDDSPRPPRRNGEKVNPRAEEINTRITELSTDIAEHTGQLVLQGVDGGTWSRWVDRHPAREEGEPGHSRDNRVTGGYCNADDLLGDLGTYAYTWNGDPVADGDWEFIASKAAGGDLNELARIVVVMHETAVDIPKLLSAWREGMRNESD